MMMMSGWGAAKGHIGVPSPTAVRSVLLSMAPVAFEC